MLKKLQHEAGSVALTTLMLTAITTLHPPAGATTLLVRPGILTTRREPASMAAAVVLITGLGRGLHLLLGTRPKRGEMSP